MKFDMTYDLTRKCDL